VIACHMTSKSIVTECISKCHIRPVKNRNIFPSQNYTVLQ